MINKKNNYTFIFLVISCIFFFVPTNSYATQQNLPVAQNGKMDLQQWIPSPSSENISLKGEWAFYWNALLTPDQLQISQIQPSYVKTPSEWSNLSVDGKPLPNEGFATYHLVIDLHTEAINQPLALQVPSSSSAYKVWVNNQLLATSGTVGTSAESEKPWTYSQVVYFTSTTQTVDLVVQVSNFHQRKNGMWDSFIIGHPKSIMKENFFHGATMKLTLVGSLLMMTIFYFFTYFFRRTNVVALLFSGLCLMFSIRLSVTDGYILRYYIPEDAFYTVYTLEYLSTSLGMLLLIQYISHIFPNETHSLISKILMYISAFYSLFFLVTPPDVFTYTIKFHFANMMIVILYHIVYVFPLAIYRKRKWAWANFITSLFVILSLFNDWLYYIVGTSTILLHYVSVFLFFLVQIVTVAHQMANAHRRLEVVSQELTYLNANLEHMVDERTKELHELNDELAASNEKLKNVAVSRRKLLANISHDIGTPMQSALGFVEMLSGGLIRENQEKYLHIVLNKLLFMKKLTDDLFDLVKLEENQITYQFTDENAEHFYNSIQQQFMHDFLKSDLTFIAEPFPQLYHHEQAYINMDVFRMNQVIQNLLQNAIKFTPAGGAIRIRAEIQRDDEHIIFHIADSGIGMDKEQLSKVFKRFYKADEARLTANGGMGLGLCIAKEITLAHHGDILASSEKDKGSIFSIILPVEIKTDPYITKES
ncbi:sensor histidine kinase [Lysinibacillus sp. LZ02]|uniref:sensor histidine kinase n=1 Tax=Lysinibacillus sp. LZ02 TaxID=3420668 RepID=UPI003D362632